MAKKTEDQGVAATPPGPTPFEVAMAEITAEANKLIAAGVGTHDAYDVAIKVWNQCEPTTAFAAPK